MKSATITVGPHLFAWCARHGIDPSEAVELLLDRYEKYLERVARRAAEHNAGIAALGASRALASMKGGLN